MALLPLAMDIRGWRCLVVGGGAIAARRTRSLLAAGAAVTVVAPDICQSIADLPSRSEDGAALSIHRRAFRDDDLDGVRLVVIATNDAAVNEHITALAKERGALINHAEDATRGDLRFAAASTHGPLTLAVHSAPPVPAVSGALLRRVKRALGREIHDEWQALATLLAAARRQGEQEDREDRSHRPLPAWARDADVLHERIEAEGIASVLDTLRKALGGNRR